MITLAIYRKILASITIDYKDLWGTKRPRNFNEAMLLITLFKDIKGCGYRCLQNALLPYASLGNYSLQHNVKVIRQKLLSWAKTVIIPDNAPKLFRNAAALDRPKPCDNVNLWIDSTDFRISGKRSVHRDKKKWSRKCSGPARRFVTIANAKGATQWISPSYFPTNYDSDIVIKHSDEIDNFKRPLIT